jgi:hypothetical protein
MNVPISEGGPRDLLNKISDHLQQTHKEVRGYLEELDADFGVNADDHHPIYYSVQLWNALISKRS